MNRNGFTLIEIIVTMAILSILAGILVPISYRVWDDSRIAQTKERMAALKIAIAGDPKLYQQGLRTHYGFVGDLGDLPDSLDDLVTNSGPGWRGPYLSGYNAATFNLDTWENPLAYIKHDPPLEISGEKVVATLRSAGPDGEFDTADDINENSDLSLQILEKEVWPTAAIRGNLNITITATTAPTPTYYAQLIAEFPNETASTGCFPLTSIGQVPIDETRSFTQGFDTTFSDNLPIGKITLRNRLFKDLNCGGVLAAETSMTIFVSDGLSVLSVNPPTLYRID